MLTLSNGAKVLAAFTLPASPGMKTHGLVLAEPSPEKFVTWMVHCDYHQQNTNGEWLWECDTGHYFEANEKNREKAEFDFGMRLTLLLTDRMAQGFRMMRD